MVAGVDHGRWGFCVALVAVGLLVLHVSVWVFLLAAIAAVECVRAQRVDRTTGAPQSRRLAVAGLLIAAAAGLTVILVWVLLTST